MKVMFEKALNLRIDFVREALKALEATDDEIDRVIEGYQTDFRKMMDDPDAFIQAFRKATGLTPDEYIKRAE